MNFLSKEICPKAAMIIIPSVEYEFTRGAKTTAEINKYSQIIADLGIVKMQNLENKAAEDDSRNFIAVFNRCAMKCRQERGPSYTDSLLCLATYLFSNSNSWLFSANYRDIPPRLFTREYTICIDNGIDVRTESLYRLDKTAYGMELKKFLKE